MNLFAVLALRSPIIQDTVNFESASIAIHVQISPAVRLAEISGVTFFSFA
jgi:hypothetical protein